LFYVNFERTDLTDVFSGELEPGRIVEYLSALHGRKIEPDDTLIILDEVQEIPRALTSLKYFAEEAPEYAICCAGSNLGVTLHEHTSFPVGKIDLLELFSMSFTEFLIADGQESLAAFLESHKDGSIPSAIEGRLSDKLKQYFIIGGMPGVVSEWIDTHDYNVAGDVQKAILDNYNDDFSKHVPDSIVDKVKHVWDSVPSQLARENRKFVYGLVREGARAREYETALLWLKDMGFVFTVYRISKPGIPIKAYEDLKAFKLFMLDVGLLSYKSGLSHDMIVKSNRMYTEFKGALTEQYVFGELQKNRDVRDIHYWTSESSAEVDFVISANSQIIPVEVKAEENLKSKSLRRYRESYSPPVTVRTSLSGYREDDGLVNIPLYALSNLSRYVCGRQGL
jgi:predicted AAA+ superfamily ATPase